jgi:hypothetical protein
MAFALAFVFGAAPVAGQACEVMCAEHVGHTFGTHSAVSHHHHTEGMPAATTHHHAPSPEALSAQRLAMTMGAWRNCVQSDAVVSESRQVVRGPMLDAITGSANTTLAIASVLRPSATDRQHGPQTPTRSISQLRV